jgi:methylmalonyl-CoA mutase C-terminal domain/subunit
VIVGGIIPDADAAALKAEGVAAVYPPGTAIQEIAGFISANVQPPC